MFAKLDEFGILDVIVVDDYWNRKVLHGLEIEQRPRVCGWQAQHSVQLSSLQAGPKLHAAASPPLLNILCAQLTARSQAHQPGSPCAQRDCVQTFWKIPSYGAAGRPAPQFGEDFFILRLRQNLQEWHLTEHYGNMRVIWVLWCVC